MECIFNKSTIVILLTTLIFMLNCDSNPIGSKDNVNNTYSVVTEAFSFEVSVNNHSQLRLEGINGNVLISGVSESDSVIITGERLVGSESTKDAEEHLQDLEVRVQDLTNEVYVKTIQPQKTHGRNYTVNYSITLPENIKIIAENVNGAVTINSISNYVSADNTNGQITLNEIFSSVSANLVNGQIKSVIYLPSDGTINMSTVNGNIELDIPQNTSAELSGSLVNGSISISDLDIKNLESSPFSLKGKLGDGQGTISLSTVNGNISVSGF